MLLLFLGTLSNVNTSLIDSPAFITAVMFWEVLIISNFDMKLNMGIRITIGENTMFSQDNPLKYKGQHELKVGNAMQEKL